MNLCGDPSGHLINVKLGSYLVSRSFVIDGSGFLLASPCTSCPSVMMNGSSPISATEDLTLTVDLFISFQDCYVFFFCAFLWLHCSKFLSDVNGFFWFALSLFSFIIDKQLHYYQ